MDNKIPLDGSVIAVCKDIGEFIQLDSITKVAFGNNVRYFEVFEFHLRNIIIS